MNKCHQPVGWRNDTTPALNETNLNYEDGCIDIIDDRVVAMDTAKLEAEDVATVIKNIQFSDTTGIFTFTRYDNSTFTLDTKLEKVVTNWTYDSSTQSLVLTLADGSTVNIPLSDFITETEFEDSATIGFTVLNHTVTAMVKGHSIGDAQMQTGYLTDCQAAASTASGAATTATNKATLAESYAVGGTGTRAGEDTDNAKYYKEQAQAIAAQTLGGLTDVTITSPQDGQALVYDAGNSGWVNGKSGILPHVIVLSDTGSTVTLTKGAKVVTATETSTGHFEADVDEYGTWTISVSNGGLSATDTIIVDTVKIYSVTITLFNATITVNYPDNMRGQTFTCVNGAVTLTQTAPSNANTLSFSATTTGTWTVTGEYSKSVVITTDGETQTLTFYALKTFATATDQEIADMVSEADLGFIDLYDDCGWRVGQEHSVTLTAINASGTYDGVSWSVGESQSAQTVTFVLMHKGLYELVNPVLNKQGQTRNTCSFVVGMKDCLDTKGYMNSTDTNLGSWNGCARRNWCNGGFRSAIPSALRTAFKQFKTITADDISTSSMTTSNDYFALPAAREVWDSYDSGQIGLNATEWSSLTRFTWYETTSNWSKESSGALSNWWHRSVANLASAFARLYPSNGVVTKGSGVANAAQGLSPFGCL